MKIWYIGPQKHSNGDFFLCVYKRKLFFNMLFYVFYFIRKFSENWIKSKQQFISDKTLLTNVYTLVVTWNTTLYAEYNNLVFWLIHQIEVYCGNERPAELLSCARLTVCVGVCVSGQAGGKPRAPVDVGKYCIIPLTEHDRPREGQARKCGCKNLLPLAVYHFVLTDLKHIFQGFALRVFL